MGTRQYIGARYVPKFFDFGGSTEWRSGVAYEALTIVTRNGNSYTSKQNVPSNIGEPEDNPLYWAATGIYNQQIAVYTQEVDDLRNKVKYDLPTVDPMDFGAVGDGVTDDSEAVERAAENGVISNPNKVFYIASSITVEHGAKDTDFKLDKDATIDSSGNWFNCKFEKTGYSVSDRGHWALVIKDNSYGFVIGCSFKNMNSCLDLFNCKDFHVDSNSFDHIPQTAFDQGGNGYGIILEKCTNIIINNNVFLNVGRHSVYISQSPDESVNHTNDSVIISNNLFKWDSNKTGDFSGNETSIIARACKNTLSIIDNVFDNVMSMFLGHGQVCGGVWNKIDNLIIEGNTCYNVHNANTNRRIDGLICLNVYPPLTAESVTNAIIKNNNFGETENTSIARLDGAKYVTFENNSFTLTGSLATPAIRSQPTVDGVCYLDTLRIKNCKMHVMSAGYLLSIPVRNASLIEINNCDIYCTYLMQVDATTTLGKLKILNNHIDAYVYTYLGAGNSISEVYTEGNVMEKVDDSNRLGFIRIRDLPTGVFVSCDGVVNGYSNNTTLPTKVINGAIYVLDSNDVYLGVRGVWRQIN